MFVTLFGISMLVKPVQLSKATDPMLVTLLGISILVKLLQPENADEPMLVTLLGISILVKPVQSRNAYAPMFVTLLGISMLVKLLQPENAPRPMLVPPVIITFSKFVGTYDVPPKIYPKYVLIVPSNVAPTNGIVSLIKLGIAFKALSFI